MFGENVRLAHEAEFPSVVSIRLMIPDRIRPEIDHVCSGVLVSLRDVLTFPKSCP
jgi:hypothetical protein